MLQRSLNPKPFTGGLRELFSQGLVGLTTDLVGLRVWSLGSLETALCIGLEWIKLAWEPNPV